MVAIDPQGGTIFDPRDMIRRIYVKLQTQCCYSIQNIEAFALVVSEKRIFTSRISHYKSTADDYSPRLGPVWFRGARLTGFIKRTTIHCYTENMEVLGLVISKKKIFLRLFHCKSKGAKEPQGGAISNPQGHAWQGLF